MLKNRIVKHRPTALPNAELIVIFICLLPEAQGTYLYMFKMNQISLIEKLDEFIRKYYKNMCLRGGLIALGIIAAGVLVVSALENFSRFGVGGRTVLFYLILMSVLGVVFSFILSPVLKLLKLGRIISHKEASEIIGVHFPSHTN